MTMRFILAALVALGVGSLPLAAQSKDGPAATMQMAPLGKVLADIKAAANLVAGDTAVMGFDNALKSALGEQGFTGLDLKRPVLGYMVYDEKDIENVRLCVLMPITKGPDFIDFLKRCHLDPEAVDGEKGLYKLGQFDLPQPMGAKEFIVHARLTDTIAYIGMNLKPAELDAAKLYKPEQILDAKETALFAFRQYNDRMPPEMVDKAAKQYQDMMEQMKGTIAGPGGAEFMAAFGKMMDSIFKLSKDAKDSGVRFTLDTTSGEMVIDSYYTPKAGTAFAKLTAARAQPTNLVASMIGKDTAAAMTIQLPVGMKEMQDVMQVGIDKLKEKEKEDPPPPFAKDMVHELILGVERTIKSGTWDHAAAINGPDKDGHYTASVAMNFEDARGIEKAIKANINDFPAEFRENVKLDAAKIGDVNIHVFDPPAQGEPPAYQTIFGDRKMYFAFGPKGIYGAIGNDAKDALKAMIEGKPAPAKAFNILVNPKKVTQLITAAEPNIGAMAEGILGTEDKLQSAISYSLEGGDALRFKFAINLKMIPHWVAQGALMRR